ncbi:MAG: hypothetical protein MUC80_00345 [Candidatus Thermoplasmatota archaeon]|jgi:hypothetical protein|nr:hypothetical protein [Candidatus Thermoplasmatota archaeon]
MITKFPYTDRRIEENFIPSDKCLAEYEMFQDKPKISKEKKSKVKVGIGKTKVGKVIIVYENNEIKHMEPIDEMRLCPDIFLKKIPMKYNNSKKNQD